MGDIADWMVDQALSDPERYYDEPMPVKCKYCGQGDLWWFQDQKTEKWYLVGMDSKRHTCKTRVNNFTAGKED